jgi:maltooligosyltrehalose trehalohydrolase
MSDPQRVRHRMPFGTELDDHEVRFRLWAPGCDRVVLEQVDRSGARTGEHPMTRSDGGWHRLALPTSRSGVGAGMRYRFRLPDGLVVPDPASRHNPEDVHGPSEVIDPLAYRWRSADWTGRPWHTAVVYELHVGSFTPEGSFAAAAERLPQLQALGITAVELMPVADFPGTRGWGYDGVLPFAPEARYGRPEDLKRFVDTAHALGLMVLLDVVYNHFGPDGNYLHAYAPGFFDASRSTPWGPAIHLDGAEAAPVRRFFVDNALYWIEEFRLDGLRLDAVHAIRDESPQHLVAEIAAALRDGPGRERQVHLVLENEHNTARWLLRDAEARPLVATAQWNDDLHHAAHVLATGERDGYYVDYAEQPARHLACALAAGFVYQGQPSPLRGGAPRGEPSALLPSVAFVSFLQNHDQVGNRALGERLDALAPPAMVEALLACLLLSPHVPMLFMGEEFAATTPFLYFCDFTGDLGRAVAEGRRAEFAGFPAFADPAARERIPDPTAMSTFEASRLRWDQATTPAGQRRQAWVARLLALRREHLLPLLPLQRHGGALVEQHGEAFAVEWPLGAAGVWCLRANLGREAVAFETGADERVVLDPPRGAGPTAAAAPASDRSSPARKATRLRLAPDTVQVALRPATAPGSAR